MDNPDSEYTALILESKQKYEAALQSLSNPEPLDIHKNCLPLQKILSHKTFLEELVFWTLMFQFPQKVVCLLLHMLPDADYKVCINLTLHTGNDF